MGGRIAVYPIMGTAFSVICGVAVLMGIYYLEKDRARKMLDVLLDNLNSIETFWNSRENQRFFAPK
jgi:hypothetical protein